MKKLMIKAILFNEIAVQILQNSSGIVVQNTQIRVAKEHYGAKMR